ncbi:Type 2 DNA topoisomerase 6 subunit B-like isoform A [Glycine soja]|uniref:Type 2 DNA topoisomerase 6 subunit B-like isoform A n=1 Tax=Glycine soja TaxID=3848 RepID=A0A445LY47_GLYSO|nr:Type 2 DNA topoisomerase 6 subunit B-like isoform A [Glycine soja]
MEFSSAQKLCLHLISSAYQRCRLSEQICRLAVILTRSSSSHPSLQISISDTGIGSCLEEFQDLRFSSTDVADNWDGVLSLKTTGIGDTEIHNFQINLKGSGSSRITRLTPNTKNGAKFRHMLILKIPNVAIQLVAEDCDVPESRYEKVFLTNECKKLPMSASNLELLKSGIEDYVLKHGNNLSNKCNSCFPSWEQRKVGSGEACCTDNRLHIELVMEAAIVISNISMQNTTCFREYGNKTEVLYFKDFSPCTISQSSVKALQSIDWKTYGLNLGGIVEQDGVTLLEWENFPTDTHIDIVLHSYHKQYPALNRSFLSLSETFEVLKHTTIPAPRKMSPLVRNLVKKAVKLSLDDLKANHPQAFLSSRAVEIRSYAPDLAKTIAGLILSSSDLDFQGECFSLLGLQSQEVGTEIVENCIEERIVSVIEMNDKKSYNSQEPAPFLFEEDPVEELEFQENDSSPLDF